MTVRTVGIEQFAAWAVQAEWPKLRAAHLDADEAWRAEMRAAVANMSLAPRAALGTGGMNWSLMVAGGSVPMMAPQGDPHPDAVLFKRACQALAAEAQSPAYDVEDCLSDQRQRLALGPQERLARDWRHAAPYLDNNAHDPCGLVVAYAAMARAPNGGRRDWTIARPDWHPEPIERSHLVDASGGRPRWFAEVRRRVRISEPGERPVQYQTRAFEEEGYDPRRRRPLPSAYRKVVFEPDPAFVARARHVYALWWCALEYLAAWLEASGALSAHVVAGPQGPEKPWQSAANRAA